MSTFSIMALLHPPLAKLKLIAILQLVMPVVLVLEDIFGILHLHQMSVQAVLQLVAHVLMQLVVLAVLMIMHIMEVLVFLLQDVLLLLLDLIQHALHVKLATICLEEHADYYQTLRFIVDQQFLQLTLV